MRVRIGTSGYAYRPWLGRFYPRDLPAEGMLAWYATRFDTVEINSSFYREPSASAIAAWRAVAPRGFRFALKAPALITHRKRLRGIGADGTRLAALVAGFGAKRGPVLMQLPPNLACDLPRLREALAAWPATCPLTIEFRHASWFAEPVYAALREARAALCIADTEDLATPIIATAPWGYLRLRRLDYDARALTRWARHIRAQAWREVFVFFRHEDRALGPGFALDLARRLDAGAARSRKSSVAGGDGRGHRS